MNVLLDAVGAIAISAAHRQPMAEAGCRVAPFVRSAPSASTVSITAIIAASWPWMGGLGITGGSGTSGKWAGNGRMKGHWRDTDVLIEGPVVAQFQGAFVGELARGDRGRTGRQGLLPPPSPDRGPVGAQAVRSSPAGGSVSMYTMFLFGHGVGAALDPHHQTRTSSPTRR